jgi:putative oxidoreductase
MFAALRSRLDTIFEPLAYLLLRAVCGIWLVAHGWPKWQAGIATFAANSLARRGFEPSLPLAYLVVSLEVVGGALIAIGLLTRPIAAIAAAHLAFITFWVVWPNGFPWTRPNGGGWEYPAMWTVLLLFIAVRGGGAYSLDRLLSRHA